MVELGEKIRQLREEKGYTQQELADKLYVTRQAVSRWECGARYPDLIMAKKIAEVFDVSIDELMSGEEINKCVDDNPASKKSPTRYVEIILYAIAVGAHFIISQYMISVLFSTDMDEEILSFFDIYIYIQPVKYMVIMALVIVGLILALQNKMTPKKTGIIMGIYFTIAIIERLVCDYVEMLVNKQAGIVVMESDWDSIGIVAFVADIVMVMVIVFYFIRGKNRLLILLYILSGIQVVSFIYNKIIWITNIHDFSFQTIATQIVYAVARPIRFSRMNTTTYVMTVGN